MVNNMVFGLRQPEDSQGACRHYHQGNVREVSEQRRALLAGPLGRATFLWAPMHRCRTRPYLMLGFRWVATEVPQGSLGLSWLGQVSEAPVNYPVGC